MATSVDQPDAPAVRRRGWKWPIIAVVSLMIIGTFVLFIMSSFMKSRHSSMAAGDPNSADGIRITANVVDVAPADKVVRLRLAFEPVGALAADTNFLSKPVHVVVIGGADVVHDSYEAGQIMLPADVRIPLRSGTITMYPLDRYQSTMRLEVTDADGTPIPTALSVEASSPGYLVEITSQTKSAIGSVRDLTLRVTRAPTTLFFALFTSMLMLTLTTIVILTLFWLLRGGASESVRFMIPLILVLLFAFPAMRSFVPGVPPLGVLLDFFAFFWCEIALGIAVVVVYATLMRELRKSALEKEADAHEEAAA